MLRPILNKPLTLFLIASLLPTIVGSKQVFAQLDEGFIGQETFDSEFREALGDEMFKKFVEEEEKAARARASERYNAANHAGLSKERENLLNKLDSKIPPNDEKMQETHESIKQALFAINDERSQEIEARNKIKGLPVPEPSQAQKAYRDRIRPVLQQEFGKDFDEVVEIAGEHVDTLLGVYETYLDAQEDPFRNMYGAIKKVRQVLEQAPEIETLLEKTGVDIDEELQPTNLIKRLTGQTPKNNNPSRKVRILREAVKQLGDARRHQRMQRSALPAPQSSPYSNPNLDVATVPQGHFQPPPLRQLTPGSALVEPNTRLAYEIPKKEATQAPAPTLGQYIQAVAELHTIDNEEFVDGLIDAEIEKLHEAAETSRRRREEEMILVNQWVIRQETVWQELQPKLIASGIPPARQWTILTKVVYAKPEYYGPRVFIDSLNPTLVTHQAPAPVIKVTADGADAANTQATNAVVQAGVAKFRQTQTRPYLVSAEVPTATPTVVHHRSAEVATSSHIHVAPAPAVKRTSTRTVRSGTRVVARPVVQAEPRVNVVTSPPRVVVRPRPIVEAPVRTVRRTTAVVAAPAVTVVRARPIVRARPVVRSRTVVRRSRLR